MSNEIDIKGALNDIQKSLNLKTEEFNKTLEAMKKEKSNESVEFKNLEKKNASLADELSNLEKQFKVQQEELEVLKRAGADAPDRERTFNKNLAEELFRKHSKSPQEFDNFINKNSSYFGRSVLEGGMFIETTIGAIENQYVATKGVVNELASSLSIGGDSYEVPIYNTIPQALTKSEMETPSETDKVSFKMVKTDLHTLYAKLSISTHLLEDASFDIVSFIRQGVMQRFMETENAAFINGTGIDGAKGILSYADGSNFGEIQRFASQNASGFDSDGLISFLYELPSEYTANANLVMNRKSWAQIATLRNTAGDLEFQRLIGEDRAANPTFHGYPVKFDDNMPNASTASSDDVIAIFGDFRAGYQIIRKPSFNRVVVDPYTNTSVVKYTFERRYGGAVKDFNAFKLLRKNSS